MLLDVTHKHKYKTRLLSDDDPAHDGCMVAESGSFVAACVAFATYRRAWRIVTVSVTDFHSAAELTK
tara:strand:- start:75 stop:275 length:201 start_codon:yes stop_codon:yes gene_type:complete